MAKRPQRTKEQQEYRDNLAHDLKNLRKNGDTWRDLAKTLLEEKKESMSYRESETKRLNERNKKNEEFNKIAREEISKWNFDSVLGRASRFNQFDSKIWDMLSETWYCERVWENTRKFKSLGSITYDKFVESGHKMRDILGNIDIFENHNHIINDLISRKLLHEYDYCMRFFRWLNKETFQKLLLWDWLKWFILSFYINEYTFTWLDKESFAEMLNIVTPSDVKYLKTAMKRFNWLDKESFLYARNKCLNDWYDTDRQTFENAIIENIENFEWLDEEVANILIEDWYWKYVEKHPEIFWLKKENN